MEASQKSPVVVASQSVVPQAQLAGLAAVPSVVRQATDELHELNEEVQKSPVVAASQSAAPHAQFTGLAAVPSTVAQAAKELHELNEEVQKSPVVAASQSVMPHAQFAELAAVPSVVAQVGTVVHRSLLEVSQKSPIPDQQSKSPSPHLQTSSFSSTPLVRAHAAALLQVLDADVQTSPVVDVQAPEAPQTQGAGLAVAPSTWGQAGAVKDPTVA